MGNSNKKQSYHQILITENGNSALSPRDNAKQQLFVVTKVPFADFVVEKEGRDGTEAAILQPQHPNLQKIEQFAVDKPNSCFTIFTAYLTEGNLTSLYGNEMIQNKAIDLMTQILEGVKYLHEKTIVHHRLKPQNILLTNGRPLIADWFVRESNTSISHAEKLLNKWYVAPQIQKGNQITKASNVWSLGLIFLQLLVGRSIASLFQDEQFFVKDHFNFCKLISEIASAHIKLLIYGMLNSNPVERPTVQQILLQIKVDSILQQSAKEKQSIVRLCYETFQDYLLSHKSKEYVGWICAKYLEVIRDQAGKNNQKACFLLGRCYTLGIEVDLDKKQARKWLLLAASKNQVFSNYNLYLQQQNQTQKERYFKKAVENNDLRAITDYGINLFKGLHGEQKDQGFGLRYLQQAANRHYPRAYYQLIKIYDDQNGNHHDSLKTQQYLNLGLQRRSLWASEYNAIQLYKQNKYSQAIQQFKIHFNLLSGECQQQDKGWLQANLGECYQQNADNVKAVKYLKLGAAKNNRKACLLLAQLQADHNKKNEKKQSLVKVISHLQRKKKSA